MLRFTLQKSCDLHSTSPESSVGDRELGDVVDTVSTWPPMMLFCVEFFGGLVCVCVCVCGGRGIRFCKKVGEGFTESYLYESGGCCWA